ncbi:MAG: DUF1059 domain-containing protein [Candidatus Thermoplasmatota archaeon]|jgi:predicted small metal-binding protein|nr:DUF1059 domain-containing protein [Candidatus Thermoplasmatota archaeon]
MTFTFKCRDLGYDCSFEYEAKERKDLMPRIKIHYKYAHNVFEMKPDLEQKIDGAIKEKA